MILVGAQRLEDCVRTHPEASASLRRWRKVIESTRFVSVDGLRRAFGRSYDYVRPGCHVFDIANNRFRLAARVDFESGTVLVQAVMTHKEYDGWRCL